MASMPPVVPLAIAPLAIAGVLAGAMNALAGGVSFVSLPALIAAGAPSVGANATSTVALLPGSLASAWVYRRDGSAIGEVPPRALVAVTVAGARVGSILLLATPSSAFDDVLPWLLLAATLSLAGGPALSRWFARRRVTVGPTPLLAAQFGLGIYGGYFGGAVGIMMMAAWSLLADADLKRVQSARTLLVSAANAVAVAVFVLAGVVRWRDALVLGAGALVGGYLGAHLARWLPATLLRAATVLLCAAVTVLFFRRA
jgi:uncharacterized membrane protein YfcA